MYVTVYNTSSSAVTVDSEGREVAARDWGTVLTTADEAKVALESDVLVPVSENARQANPTAAAAIARTASIAERAAALADLDKGMLADLAVTGGWDPGTDPLKPDLVHGIAMREHIVVPPAPESAEEPPPASNSKSRRSGRSE
jgi:hypothetical protein